MLTGLRPASYDNMQLNAGIFLRNFDYSSATDAASLAQLIKNATANIIGATRGGGQFTCRPTIRGIEVDGKRADFVGSEINDGWEVRMSGTMLEFTPENLKNVLVSADVTTSGKVTTITVRTEIKKTDYIPHLCWVGDLLDGRMAIIELDNALNINGATFTFKDKGEGVLPFDFKAHYGDVLNQDAAPCRVEIIGKTA